ncbi:ABC transporter ATP-binding protein [Halorubellus sp. JP-L1]|uniref:energy-coupling factor ABC transporter ATP-binding protein n=1 Tax=Halorubellus sp. JP-L1 TaxID=2715753 RepID=UPI00140E6618|nr:ABC transporter ATP-binding protein [Halorubellus sp. JP-L1]NHN43109.1 ABC transporter ATP-binding protein [Halorubellus sp. JP-L1]
MITVRDATVHRGDAVVLEDVSLSVDDGEFLVLAGANGAGKTTLVRQFNGLLEPDSGEVLVNGRRVADDLVAARTAVGMVFQDPRDQFVAATVRADVAFGPENLGLPREEIATRVDDALAAVGMDGRGEERLDELSGGEQSRVAIAGALAMAPDHVVLDEPLASLDAPSRDAVRDHLAALHADGTSVVVVTHDLDAVSDLADRIVVLADGEIALDGPPGDVRGRLDELDVRPW